MRIDGVRLGAGIALLTLFASALLGACDGEVLNPVPLAAGGDGGDGTSAGGSGGEAWVPGRGDPADFPTDCIETCAEACDRLDECGGATSALFPLERDACLTRCGLALDGPVWDDVSGPFRCCASQDSCARVEHCGGWLDHPAVVNACDKTCSCFFGSAIAEAYDGLSAPTGYRFADDALFVALPEGARMPAFVGLAVEQIGRYASVYFGNDDARGLRVVRASGEVLPTFRDRSGRLAAASGNIVVEIPGSAARSKTEAITKRHAGGALRDLRLGHALHVVRVDPWRALDAVAELNAAGVAAELDMLRRYEKRFIPDDPLFADQWHLLNVAQGGAQLGVDARVSEAWDITQGDPQVIIAINDDGVDIGHSDFSGKLEPALNFPADWQDLMGMGLFGGHGTAVAGVAGARGNDSFGGAGVCPGCRVLPHRLGESNFNGFQLTDVQIAEGFQAQVDTDAWVINNSWGYPTGEPTYVDTSLPLPSVPSVVVAAFDYCEQTGRAGLGTVVVFAAGNSNDKLDPYAKYATTVTVGAVGDNGLKAYYSSFGAEVNVAAPSNGGLIGITTSSAGGGHTANFGGTSSASPLVAGVFGLVLSANPSLTAAEARAIVEQSASEIDPMFGAWQNGHSVFYGHGMVDASVAVQMASGCADPTTCPAPSDDCGPSCKSGVSCASCRTHADCALDHACQALPSLGVSVCVALEGAGCPAGTTPNNGYCQPTQQICGLCIGAVEACNGRDDDCDGSVDEDDVCNGGGRCFIDGLGCPVGQACAGSRCTPLCNSDADCGDGGECKVLKNQYGASVASVKGCVANQAGLCQVGCSVIASSLDDQTLQMYVDCMMDGQATCGAAQGCAALLPINF